MVAEIGPGLLLLVGICPEDSHRDIEWVCKKIINLRIFNDKDGVMNLALKAIGGEVLAVSQFTLFASSKKGNRPSYSRAAPPDMAKPLLTPWLPNFRNRWVKQFLRGYLARICW